MTFNGRLAAKVGAAVAALLLVSVPVLEGTVYHTYADPVGVLTSCMGHTGPELKLGQVWTKAECDEQLASDLIKHTGDLECVHVPLSVNEKAAYTSFDFNVGATAFCGSTLVKKLNAGDHAGACAELSRWTMAGGRKLPGLVKRRAIERRQCETP